MTKRINLILLVVFLFTFYLIFYLFIHRPITLNSSPTLRDRLGTTLWHSSDIKGEDHIYCYYPGKKTGYSIEDGEYIIKKVSSFDQCQDWHGIAIIKESWWASEVDKLYPKTYII